MSGSSVENKQRPVILTRPGAANDRLADLLESDGVEKVWRWPAFTITLPEDQDIVSDRFAHLDDVQMVVMASCRSRCGRSLGAPLARAHYACHSR